MFSRISATFLLFCFLGICSFPPSVFCEYDYNPSTKESPDPRALAIKPTLLKLNNLVVLEVQKGLASLERNDLNSALHSFLTAIDIEPYDPMAYILLIKTLISSNQENMAYTWVERSGRNLSDSNQIVASLYNFLKDAYPPVKDPTEPLVSIAQFKDDKKCAISFIFDDGEPSVSTDILPQFEKYGFHTTIAINSGVTFEEQHDNIYRGNWDDWRKAKAHGHEIANHGANHKAIPGLTPQEMQTEINDSFKTIQDKLGEAPETFVFPEDKSTPETIKFAEKLHLITRNHESLFQTYDHLMIPVYGGKRFSIPTGRLLIDIAILRRLWLIPQCHGLYNLQIKKSFKSISPELLKDQLDYLKQNEDKIWVARFIDAYKYLKERKETKINIERSEKNELVFSLINVLDRTIYSYPLTVIINTAPFKPTKAYAFDMTKKKEISIRVVDNKIFLEVPPSGQAIQVKWQ